MVTLYWPLCFDFHIFLGLLVFYFNSGGGDAKKYASHSILWEMVCSAVPALKLVHGQKEKKNNQHVSVLTFILDCSYFNYLDLAF